MASIFSALNTGYSGLNAAQIGITTTGNNISNASTPGYTREVVTQGESASNSIASLSIGTGTKVENITRVFNQFVYHNYSSVSADKSYSDLMQNNLKQLSTYFPSLSSTGKNAGISSDLNSYFSAWQTLSDNPSLSAVKTTLAAQTTTLTNAIKATHTEVVNLQKSLNEQLKTNIDEVNTLASQIANLNKSINVAEAGTNQQANALRDKRDHLALSLSKLIGTKMISSQINGNTPVSSKIATQGGNITINIGGFNIVDGGSFHPLGIDNSTNANGMYDIYYQRQDGLKIPVSKNIQNGEVGALLHLRGAVLSPTSAIPTDGVIPDIISKLNAFAAGMIEQTNNLYAQSPTTSMQSNNLNINSTVPLVQSGLNIKQGSFNIVLYNQAGDTVASRAITIDANTTLDGGSDSIAAQIQASVDDNHDNNANDNINNFLTTSYNQTPPNTSFSIDFKNSSFVAQGYSFAIQDNLANNTDLNSGTNFAGAMGMHRFLDGTDASNIALSSAFKDNASLISANTTPVSGNNQTASNMVQMQFEKGNYNVNGTIYNHTVGGMFANIATGVGALANLAISNSTTVDAKYNAVQQQYQSISGVNTDQQMTNLLKYQTAYAAAAKVITTIEKMMNTLLSIKQ